MTEQETTAAEAVTEKVQRTARDPEIAALDKVLKVVDALDDAAAIRVLRWNLERKLAEAHRGLGRPGLVADCVRDAARIAPPAPQSFG